MASNNPKCKNRLLFSISDCVIFFFNLLVHGRLWQIRRNFHSLMSLDFSPAWERNIWSKISEFYQRAPVKCFCICCSDTCPTAYSAGYDFALRHSCWIQNFRISPPVINVLAVELGFIVLTKEQRWSNEMGVGKLLFRFEGEIIFI